jgi:hypothetical protein
MKRGRWSFIMSNVLVSVVAYGNATLQDLLGIEAYARPGSFVSQSLSFGSNVSFEVPGTVWTRVRSQLNGLAQRRIPALDAAGVPTGTGKTQPILTYSMEWVPGDRPRIHQVEGAPLDLSAPANLTLRGTNLLGGTAASKIVQTWSSAYAYGNPGTRTYTRAVDSLRFDAVNKGPTGNKIAFSIEAAGSASVVTTIGEDGEVYVKITPATGASDSTSIAAQLSGNAFITATALVASAVIGPTATSIGGNGPSPGGLTPSQAGQITKIYLDGGDGGGLARLDIPVVAGVPTNRLVLTSAKGGNDRNTITVTFVSGSDAVAVSGNNITVTRAADTSISALVTAINANASARALVVASAVGDDSLTLSRVMAKSWLYGGGGETPVATIAGAASTVVSQSDTSMELSVTNAALVAAGASAGEVAVVQVQMNYGLVAASIGLIVA